ncbi:MAG: NAD-dependent epimerase/dehydratase family protein [Bacteroidota bacterium]
MVIGNGMIATAFDRYRSKNEFVIFASGVSHSVSATAAAFAREKKLLAATIKNSAGSNLVYFGTCGVYDPSMRGSAYVQHKLEMEAYIEQHQPSYTIFRLSNPVGKTPNNDTVVNFFINHILKQEPFMAWKEASRNIIDIDDMFTVCREILEQGLFLNSVTNIANPQNYTVPYIIETIEMHFGVRGNYTLADKGDAPRIDISAVKPLFDTFNVNFDGSYLQNILQKYFPTA